MNGKRIAVIAVVAFFVAVTLANAGSVIDWEPLKGLKGIHVLSERTENIAEKVGLTKELLTIDTELRLRKAGIKIFSDAECNLDKDCAKLILAVTTVEQSEEYAHSFNINIQLYQGVTLTRDVNISLLASTWSKTATGFASANLLKKSIREQIGDCVDEFINNYLAANQEEDKDDKKKKGG